MWFIDTQIGLFPGLPWSICRQISHSNMFQSVCNINYPLKYYMRWITRYICRIQISLRSHDYYCNFWGRKQVMLCYNVDCSKPKDPKNPCETGDQPVFLLFRAKSIQSTNSYWSEYNRNWCMITAIFLASSTIS